MEKIKTKISLFGTALVLAAVLLASTPAHAQYESFFGRESWEYATAFHPITKSTADYDPYLLYCLTDIYHFTSSDTVTIDGKVYYNSSVDGYWVRPVKLREDTLHGRLYSLIDGREFLICDMSLNTGDTFRLPVSPNYDYDETMRMLVDSITFVNSKKVIHLSAISENDAYWWHSFLWLELEEAYNISLRFMEGIGPMYGLVPPYCDGDVLLCLTKDDSLYYMTHSDLGCWQDYVSVSGYPEQAITIFPNPAKDKISILLETDEDIFGEIVIRDITGRVCMQTSMLCSSTNINVESLPDGVYLLTFRDNHHHKITKKIVKK